MKFTVGDIVKYRETKDSSLNFLQVEKKGDKIGNRNFYTLKPLILDETEFIRYKFWVGKNSIVIEEIWLEIANITDFEAVILGVDNYNTG